MPNVPALPTLHLIAPFHTIPSLAFSHCAFTGKALRFPKMMQARGYSVVEYANEGSESEAIQRVTMLNREEFDRYYPKQKEHEFHGDYAKIGIRGWHTFNRRLIVALAQNVRPGDIICHPFGHAHEGIVNIFPEQFHVETGIGYPDTPFGCWRIFESNAWRHYHWGRDDQKQELRNNRGMNKAYSWVIPNYFDLGDWPAVSNEAREGFYVLYMGRITPEKGTRAMVEIIKAEAHRAADANRTPIEFIFAGQGDFTKHVKDPVFGLPASMHRFVRLSFRGVVTGRTRAQLVGHARCMIMPTEFIEPFGGAGVEGMLTGTPLLASGFGAFTETVRHGQNGFLCNTLGDWLAGIDAAMFLDRDEIAKQARARFSLEACGEQYDRAFREIHALGAEGWNRKVSYRVGPLST